MSEVKRLFEELITRWRMMAGESTPNIFFNRQLRLILTSDPPAATIDRWESDPVTAERELIELLRLDYYEFFANEAIRRGREASNIRAKNRNGGVTRAIQRQEAMKAKSVKIFTEKNRLMEAGVNRGFNKLIAKNLDLEPEYVRHILSPKMNKPAAFKADWLAEMKRVRGLSDGLFD